MKSRRVVVMMPSDAKTTLGSRKFRPKGFVVADGETVANFLQRLEKEHLGGTGVASNYHNNSNRDHFVGLSSVFADRGGFPLDVEVVDLDFVRDGDVVSPILENCASCPVPEKLCRSVVQEPDKVDWVSLNVGGRKFVTCRSTIEAGAPNSMLSKMLAADRSEVLVACQRDSSGSLLLDRSPEYFGPLLNFLRTGQVIVDPGINPSGVLEEAKYFGIEEAVTPLLTMVEEAALAASKPKDRDPPLTRSHVQQALISTSSGTELRFQGVNLEGADLSKLDLRKINFKHANMKGCKVKGANLSGCNLEWADLSNADLDGCQLMGVRMMRANLEGATLRGCRFDDPAGSVAVMEGVNLRNADLEGSNMAGVNLRVASVKSANMKNCDLRLAVLAGADLELCDLTGSDLCQANLRGANLKDTCLDLMPTPLHMSQTIR